MRQQSFCNAVTLQLFRFVNSMNESSQQNYLSLQLPPKPWALPLITAQESTASLRGNDFKSKCLLSPLAYLQ